MTPTEPAPHSPPPPRRLSPELLWRRLERAALSPVDISFLVAFRIALGLLLAISMERFLAYGWVDQLLLAPSFRFKFLGFHWVEPLPREAMLFVFQALVVLGGCVALGFLFRLSALLLALGVTYVQLIDVSTYLNHYYLAALLAWLLACTPAARSFSVDAWLRRRHAQTRSHAHLNDQQQVARGVLWLLRGQVGLVYVFAGLAKLQSDWLIHGQPLRIWLGASTDLPIFGPLFTWPGVPLLMSWLGFLFDISIVVWLSWSRTRPYAYAVVLLFHALTRLLFDIGMFPWIMSACALIFFPPDAPRRLLQRLLSRANPRTPSESLRPRFRSVALPTWGRRAALALGACYLTLQVALPLRHLLYGGNVLWHEQGMRFSWRVMVRAKGGAVSFRVLTPQGVTSIEPRQYLTAFQENEMAGQPDLIVQLAQRIADDYGAMGHQNVRVFAHARVSLNGRRAAPLVDPSADLARVRDGLGAAPYILPAPTEPPPHIRPVL